MKFKKFNSEFTYEQIENTLSRFSPFSAYSFTKRNNITEFSTLLNFLPIGYVNDRYEDIESIDLIYSGSTASPFLLTLAIGRNDKFKGMEKFDIDVINIAPETGSAVSYFSQQWHHFKDENGNRVSYEINPFIISEEEKKKDVTYSVFLTGSTSYFNFEDYQTTKPDFFNLHIKSFGDLNM
ncbi:MAG: hypothetical protein Q8K92_06645 [Leadbetterella sp.]|nr:hypothetical protein [Leadbetterella sp.]